MSTRFINILTLLLLTLSTEAQRSDSLIVETLRQNGITFSHNNSITLLTSGQEKYDDMFEAIRQAKSSVHLEYFNFRNDSIASALFDVLAEKAREGVEIRAMFDAFGNMSNNRPLKKRHLEEIRAKGIEIVEYDPTGFPWINHVWSRDHRKIVVIDGQIAYTGGMNVADYYIHGTEVVGEWHDMHCRLEGDEVNKLQRIFLDTWNKETKQNVSGDKYFRAEKKGEGFKGLKTDTTITKYHKMVGIINREPYKSPKIMRQFYIACLDNAKDSIKILNPYISLTHSVKKAIKRALKRGIKFEIMMAENSDIPIQPDVSFANLHWMMKRGARVFIYQGGFHHTKIVMVDGGVCTVGSCNLDARSLNYDREANAVIVDRHTTKELEQIFEKQKKRCFILTPEKWKTWRTPSQKFTGWWARLLNTWI